MELAIDDTFEQIEEEFLNITDADLRAVRTNIRRTGVRDGSVIRTNTTARLLLSCGDVVTVEGIASRCQIDDCTALSCRAHSYRCQHCLKCCCINHLVRVCGGRTFCEKHRLRGRLLGWTYPDPNLHHEGNNLTSKLQYVVKQIVDAFLSLEYRRR